MGLLASQRILDCELLCPFNKFVCQIGFVMIYLQKRLKERETAAISHQVGSPNVVCFTTLFAQRCAAAWQVSAELVSIASAEEQDFVGSPEGGARWGFHFFSISPFVGGVSVAQSSPD